MSPLDCPHENTEQVESAYNEVLKVLHSSKFNLFRIPDTGVVYDPPKWGANGKELREERYAVLKEAIRKLFELEAWESW